MEYQITAHKGFFELKISGAIDAQKYPSMFDTLFAHKDWVPGMRLLVDESELRADHLTIADLETIAVFCTDRSSDFGSAKLSMYVSRDLEYGLNRMWHVFIKDGWDAEGNVFRSREEALDWLE
ncbi:MAG: hypothetical protein DIZ80_16720 [endosymbiont of Galathealinum brachiosum]|uniref:STAS/SEC14 domain-containing protein n=1 Tax=endosymbiont of Galathealinum brachiosum TaxID=2200906 RepID=A0A370D6K9_9GAMM|nr:MAG: hypothetical protein DIZ80_16720 [endosymbiont of Galathealinum brachiosum]